LKKLAAALISLTLTCCLANSAQAGAWLQKADYLQLLFNYSYLSADKSFDTSGQKTSMTKFAKSEISPYVEYGFSEDWTIGGALSVQSLSNSTNNNIADISSYKTSSAEIFARTYLAQGDDYVIAIEPRVKLPFNQSININPEGLAPIPELKIAYGQNYSLINDYDSFSDISLNYRLRNDADLADMVKFEASFGNRPFEETPVLFLTQAFYEKSLASISIGENAGNYDLLKLQFSAAYEYDKNITLQAGYFNSIAGKNTVVGQGIIVSTWLSF